MEQKDNSKTYLIIIAVLLLIIGIGVGYIIGTNNKPLDPKKEEPKETIEKIEIDEEDKEDEKEPEPEKEEESNSDSTPKKEIIKGTLNSDISIGEKDSKTISLNNKQLEISYENIDDNGPGTRKLKVGTNVIGSWSPNGLSNIKYEVITGSDNKDYLVIRYQQWANYGYIINDEGKTIYYFDTNVKDLGCVAYFDDLSDEMSYIENNEVYYYKYRSGSANNNNSSLKTDLVKLSINNNKVTETKTGTVKDGKFGQCS